MSLGPDWNGRWSEVEAELEGWISPGVVVIKPGS